MQMLDLPTEIRSVLREFSTCEVTTVNRRGGLSPGLPVLATWHICSQKEAVFTLAL